jgi:hypothetical protein
MVACVITAIALLGVYEFSRRVSSVAADWSQAWYSRTVAEPVADEIAGSLERLVIVQDYKPLVIKSSGNGSSLICQTPTARIRYNWYPEEVGVSVDRQLMAFSGSVCIQPDVPPLVQDEPQKDFDTDQRWEAVERVRIGQALRSVSVSYKRRKHEGEKDKELLQPGVVWIRVSAGNVPVARPVEVALNAKLVGN